MIVTNFLAGQGLGNQLWVYASCRGIAANLQRPFRIGGLEYFKGEDFLQIDVNSFSEIDPKHADTKNSKIVTFRERLFYDPDLKYFASDYDSRVEKIKSNVHLEGLFQSDKYLYGREHELGQWIRLSKEMNELSLKFANICILNIRGGEYKRHKNLILPKNYWLNAMRHMRDTQGVVDFLIVTDDANYAKNLLPGYPILHGGIAECYAALHGASFIIVSNSSFSYFPIKTRLKKPYVIGPYLWSRPDNIFKRWAAPCNLYNDWNWQDMEGNFQSLNDCKIIVNKTKEFYSSEYNICTSRELIISNNISKFIPNILKKMIKRSLSKIFPLKIG